MAALSDAEIVIFGGGGIFNGVIFNPVTKEETSLITGNDVEYQFTGNQHFVSRDGTVTALA